MGPKKPSRGVTWNWPDRLQDLQSRLRLTLQNLDAAQNRQSILDERARNNEGTEEERVRDENALRAEWADAYYWAAQRRRELAAVIEDAKEIEMTQEQVDRTRSMLNDLARRGC